MSVKGKGKRRGRPMNGGSVGGAADLVTGMIIWVSVLIFVGYLIQWV
jgi:hypothetical protein